MNRIFRRSALALTTAVLGLALLVTTSCKKDQPAPPAQPPVKTISTPPGVAPAPAESGQPIVSAEKTSFQEVTTKLDAGGNLYVYVGTEQWLANVSQKVGELRDLFGALPGQNRREREQLGLVFSLLERLVKGSGVESISGAGWSGIALEKGFYRHKFILHHYPGKATGNLWTMFGARPHPLYSLDLLPTNTAIAAFFDLEVEEIWSTLEKEAAASGIPELAEGVRMFPDLFKDKIGLDFDKLRASLGGEIGVVLTLDESKPVRIPLPDRMNLNTPTIGLMISIKVVDDLIFDRIDRQLSQDPNLRQMVEKVDQPDLKLRIVPVPLPLPMPVRVTVARHGDYLLLATHDDLIRAAVNVKTGKSPGLKSTAEFKRLARELPTQGNGFSYVSPRFGDAVSGILQDISQEIGRREPSAGAMIGKVAGFVRLPQTYTVAANTSEGWVVTGNSTKDPSSAFFASTMITPVATMGMLSAVAIPNFVKARSTAQKNVCINNLRQLDGAKEQWALEHKKTQTDTPTWNDLIGTDKYIRVRPVCPNGGRYTLGSMNEKPRCSNPSHSLYGDR